jgi:hypothetical protein
VIPPHGQAASTPERARLRVAFEALRLDGAAAIAAGLQRISGDVPAITRSAPLEHGMRSTRTQTWTVELSLPAMALGTEIQSMEREMLSLEYRSPGTRFLGWTTTTIPAISERPPAAGSTSQPSAGARRASQRDLVAASLLRRPQPQSDGPAALTRRPWRSRASGPYL